MAPQAIHAIHTRCEGLPRLRERSLHSNRCRAVRLSSSHATSDQRMHSSRAAHPPVVADITVSQASKTALAMLLDRSHHATTVTRPRATAPSWPSTQPRSKSQRAEAHKTKHPVAAVLVWKKRRAGLTSCEQPTALPSSAYPAYASLCRLRPRVRSRNQSHAFSRH